MPRGLGHLSRPDWQRKRQRRGRPSDGWRMREVVSSSPSPWSRMKRGGLGSLADGTRSLWLWTPGKADASTGNEGGGSASEEATSL